MIYILKIYTEKKREKQRETETFKKKRYNKAFEKKFIPTHCYFTGRLFYPDSKENKTIKEKIYLIKANTHVDDPLQLLRDVILNFCIFYVKGL